MTVDTAVPVSPGIEPTETIASLDHQSGRPTDRSTHRSRGSGSQAPVTNPREALRVDEIRRTRQLALLAAMLEVMVILVLIPMGGEPMGKLVHRIGLGVGLAGALVTLFVAAERHSTGLTVLFSTSCCIAVGSSFYYWGIFSSAVLVVPIVAYFFAAGNKLRTMIPVVVFCAIPHAVIGTLITFDVIADHGVIRPLELSKLEAIAALGIAQFVFLISFVLARGHHRSVLSAMEELDKAARAIAQREALLHEAKQELDRAMQVGGPGRFTEQTLGSYKLGNLLGRGAMGEVYEAVHVETDDLAAVKLLTPSAGAEPRLVQRFLREVQIAASLNVPNVVRVLETPPASSSIPFLVMERLRGRTLGDVLRARSRLRPSEAVEMMNGVAAGVSAAHAAGIVHRDLKPRNVFAHEDPSGRMTWKILDFGISKLAGSGGTLTRDQVVGTPGYMAPEQARGLDVDERVDIYAMGVIAYRVLTGRPAFTGKDAPSVLYLVTHGMPPRPSSIARLDEGFDSVLAVALAKDPDERFQTPEELAAALEAAAARRVGNDIHTRAAAITAKQDWGSVR